MSPAERYELLIVGGGPAALSAARAYRDAGGTGPVAFVTDEQRMPYMRPALSKELLRGEIGVDDVALEPDRWPAEHDVELIGGRAVALDPQKQTVRLSGGRDVAYNQCLLATGSEPKRLPIPGADDPGVRTLRSLQDARELLDRLHPATDVVVIGSGFIGCEIAASLRMRGQPVALVADEPAPNAARLGERAANELRGWLDELGVRLLLGSGVEAIERADDRLTVRAQDDRAADGALVVMAVGVAPRSELAAHAGVERDGGAVTADAHMRTATPGLLAAGDVCLAQNAAAGRPIRIEHWGDALGQGEVAGRTAAGQNATWDSAPGFWSTIGEHTIKYAGWGDGFDEVRFETHGDDAFAVWYGRDDTIVGVLAHNVDDAYEGGQELITAGAPWS